MLDFVDGFCKEFIFWGVTGLFSLVSGKFMLECKKQRALRDGVKAILRSDLIQLCNHYEEKGWAPFYAVENITNMYNAYHDLGGNGAITQMYERFLALPSHAPSVRGGDLGTEVN